MVSPSRQVGTHRSRDSAAASRPDEDALRQALAPRSRRLAPTLPAQIHTALEQRSGVIPATVQYGRVISGVAAHDAAGRHPRRPAGDIEPLPPAGHPTFKGHREAARPMTAAAGCAGSHSGCEEECLLECRGSARLANY